MDQKIDDASYNEGRADFDNGVTLRSVVERVMVADSAPEEAKAFSLALGFLDGVLAALRNPAVIVAGGELIEERSL